MKSDEGYQIGWRASLDAHRPNLYNAMCFYQWARSKINRWVINQPFSHQLVNLLICTILLPCTFANLPRPLPITSWVKTYETYEMELWWLLLLADIFRRQNIEVNKCDRFCPRNFIAWSLDMSREFPWQLDYTPCCETIYKDLALFLRFFATFLRFVMFQ